MICRVVCRADNGTRVGNWDGIIIVDNDAVAVADVAAVVVVVVVVADVVRIEEACSRVLMTSNGLVRQAATVPAAPPDIRLTIVLQMEREREVATRTERMICTIFRYDDV
jgi:hypothetical protein